MNCFYLSILFAAPAALAQQTTAPRVLPYPIDLPSDYRAAIDAGTRTASGRPGDTYWTNRAKYQIKAQLDPESAVLTGQAEMTYVNRSPSPLRSLGIHLRQNLHAPGQQRTRTVEVTGGMEVTEVTIAGVKPRRLPRARDTRLTIRLPEPLAPGEETTLTIAWQFTVPTAGRAPRMGHEDDNVFYLGYWYPQFAVFDDVEGWVFDQYRGNGEFYMGYADYDLEITAPNGYLVRATGELQNPGEVLTEASQAALIQAAESRDVVAIVDAEALEDGKATAISETGELTWKFRAENVRDVAVSVANTYLWDATHAVVKDQGGPGADGITMIHAVYEPRSGDWKRAAEYSQHTIEYMSEQLYPYPWPHMTACEGIIGGGMEYPMMTVVGSRGNAGTIAHELVHMWFPMIVGSNEKRHSWQDEGFTSFFTTLCRDDFRGRSTGPASAIGGYASTVSRGGDAVCMQHADSYVNQNYGFATYSKTAAILHQLRGLIGDERFFKGFRRYVSDWAYKHPYPYDFFHTMTDVAEQPLEDYFRSWFFEAWQLDHAIDSVTSTADETTVKVVDRGRVIHPTVVEVTLDTGEKSRQTVPASHWRTHRTAELRFPGVATSVRCDPDFVTLDIARKDNRWRAK